ncbi:hypothetical protein CFB82_17745 [Burkholderia sp. HI2714]|uniref:hypothetical protein n=1 Tax=Burkholderia sp. HI2714 TaxID=2015359 RepID=UPI000B7A9C06|nr:hypothetical protein [Burkholderia sp. HI2714]OXJ32845.1 hypothetical protein CFB82_17745 [Burkholderia sp. HI2714]
MKQPKKLTLKQAIIATKKPLARKGDLLYRFHFDSGTGPVEIPGIFMPNHLDDSVKRFPQPETEHYLRDDLYAYEGYLESATHLSDKELALLSDYYGGRMRPSGVAGDFGDPSDFEDDFIEVMALLDGCPNDPSAIVRKTILYMHRKYLIDAGHGRAQSDAQSGKARKERRAKSDDKRTLVDVIRSLSREHPDSKPSEIWPHLKTSLNEWTDGEEVTEVGKGESRAYRYTPPNAENDGVRPISYGWFKKLLSEVRGGKRRI